MELERFDEVDPSSPLGQAWEALAAGNTACGLMQSLHWAAFKRRMGFRTLHLGLFDGGALVGGAIGYAVADHRGASLLVIPEGPVLPWHDEPQALAGLRLLRQAAERAAAEYGALALRVEPRLPTPRPRALRGFGRAPVDLLPTETLYLDLAAPPKALLAQMRPKGRYNIRLAERHSVTVRADRSPAAARRCYALLDEAGRRDGFFVEPPAFFDALAETLGPAGLIQVLFAEQAGDTLAAAVLATYGVRATYLYGGVSNHKRHLMAGYALQWGAIQAAQQAGCATYDFYGFEPHGAPGHLYAGFSRFKRQFGGRPVRLIGAHDLYFLDRLADVVVRAVHETLGRPMRNSDQIAAKTPRIKDE